MKNRSTELRKLVRALRAEFSRLYNTHWYTFEDEDPPRLMHLQQTAMYEIKQALHLADTGTYGTCIDCEEQISLMRLSARPTSLRCISCQERLEVVTAA